MPRVLGEQAQLKKHHGVRLPGGILQGIQLVARARVLVLQGVPARGDLLRQREQDVPRTLVLVRIRPKLHRLLVQRRLEERQQREVRVQLLRGVPVKLLLHRQGRL